MRGRTRIACLLLGCALATGVASAAENPMQVFGELVVGEWETEGSRHVLEWGVGQRVIRSRSYFGSDGEWALVSEGMWFWDAHQKTIRGIVVATGMPVELFEYQSEVRGEEIVHDLEAHGEAGGRYIERWRFAGGEYRWTLEDPKEGTTMMDGVYRRADREHAEPVGGASPCVAESP